MRNSFDSLTGKDAPEQDEGAHSCSSFREPRAYAMNSGTNSDCVLRILHQFSVIYPHVYGNLCVLIEIFSIIKTMDQ